MNVAPRDIDPPIGTLLAIDDNKIDQMIVKRIIERSGLVGELLQFFYAEDALAYLRDAPGPVDAIILDINMPRMDGFEFLEAATAEFGDTFAAIVVVMLSTSLDATDTERARKSPLVREFFDKPLVREHIERIAANLLAERDVRV